MPKVVEYHRPSSVEEALELLARPTATVLAGGTLVNATPTTHPVIAVDISRLGLSGIELLTDGRLRLGAATTLQQIVDHPLVPAVLRELARRESVSTLRTLATVGGTLAAGGPESELVAGLLVCEAEVTLRSATGAKSIRFSDLLSDCDHLLSTLIVDATIHVDGTLAADRTGRTPGDVAIVSAVARRTTDGRTLVALSGVAPTPVLVDSVDSLSPVGDFRGSAEYRKHLASVLSARVRSEVAK